MVSVICEARHMLYEIGSTVCDPNEISYSGSVRMPICRFRQSICLL
jgi:hypothetical protein